jgi:hypothetical protein
MEIGFVEVRAAYLDGDDDGPRSFATRASAVTGCVPGYC